MLRRNHVLNDNTKPIFVMKRELVVSYYIRKNYPPTIPYVLEQMIAHFLVGESFAICVQKIGCGKKNAYRFPDPKRPETTGVYYNQTLEELCQQITHDKRFLTPKKRNKLPYCVVKLIDTNKTNKTNNMFSLEVHGKKYHKKQQQTLSELGLEPNTTLLLAWRLNVWLVEYGVGYGGNRKYVMIQMDETNNENVESFKQRLHFALKDTDHPSKDMSFDKFSSKFQLYHQNTGTKWINDSDSLMKLTRGGGYRKKTFVLLFRKKDI